MKLRWQTCVCVLLTIALLCSNVSSLSIFPPSLSHAPLFLFREDRLYDVTSYNSLDKIQGHVACLGDFNNDKYTDLIVIGCDETCVKVYLWDSNAWAFSELTTAQVNVTGSAGSVVITNVVASDFNFDGALDIMITSKLTAPGDGDIQMVSDIYAGNRNSLQLLSRIPQNSVDQLLLLDVNGDTRVDFFGTSAQTGQRSYWTNQESSQTVKDFKAISFSVQTQQSLNSSVLNRLAYPATSMYADMNGDCYPDLVVVSCNNQSTALAICNSPVLEIWLNDPDSGAYGFSLKTTFPLPAGAGRPAISDINRDGTLDIVVPVCYPADSCSTTNQIVVYYNNQPSRSTGDLCAATTFTFSDDWKTIVPLGGKLLPNYRHDSDASIIIPNTIRIGDYNLDGYPDLLLTVVKTKDNSKVVTIELWENRLCSDGMSADDKATYCPGTATSKSLPYFMQRTSGVTALDNDAVALDASQFDGRTLSFSYQGFFYDIDEKGDLDVITVLDYAKGTSNRTRIKSYYNNFFDDAYFLKTMGLSAASNAYGDSRPYGVNMPGITYKFLITDMDGYYHTRAASQITQSTYLSLSTPYHMFGLGRTNGYVEEFYLGKGKISGLTMWKMWSALMPNSQLVAIPSPADNTNGWTVELFIDPGASSLWVAIAVIGTLILLGIPIIILYRYEAIQDKREKQDKAHLISNVFIG